MAEMKDQKLAAAEAEERMKLIAPLLAPGLSRETLTEMKRKICEDYHISDRTLRRYLQLYREGGFEGLKPQGRKNGEKYKIPSEILEEAIRLRREQPNRSIPTIIQILELEGVVPEGFLKRTTLQDAFARAGYSSAMMKMYQNDGYAWDRVVDRLDGDGNLLEWSQTRTVTNDDTRSVDTTTERYAIDEDGERIRLGSVETYDFKKYINAARKDAEKVARANTLLRNYLSQFENKTAGKASKFEGYTALQNMTITDVSQIENMTNQMKNLDTAYNEVTRSFRKGSSSLNPFVNAINSKNGLRASLESLKLDIAALGNVPDNILEFLSAAESGLNNLGDLDDANTDIRTYAELFGSIRVSINDARSALRLFKKTMSSNKQDRKQHDDSVIFDEKKFTAEYTLQAYEQSLLKSGRLTENLKDQIVVLRNALSDLDSASEMTLWQELFRQTRLSA